MAINLQKHIDAAQARIETLMERDRLTRAQAIRRLAAEHPDLHTNWKAAKTAQGHSRQRTGRDADEVFAAQGGKS